MRGGEDKMAEENGRIEWLREDLEHLRNTINDRFDRLEDSLQRRLDDHGRRINALENWRSWVLGVAAVLGVFGGLLWEFLRGLVQNGGK